MEANDPADATVPPRRTGREGASPAAPRPPTGRLRIGCAPHLGAQRLQTFLGACYLHVPGLDVEVFHLPSGTQRRRLRSAKLDLGLFEAADADAESDIESRPLFAGDPLAVFLPVHHPLAAGERLDREALLGRTLLTGPHAKDPELHELLMSRIARAGYHFTDVCERGGEDPRDLLFAVAEGRGIAIGPLSLPTAAGDVGRLVTVRALDPPQAMPDTVVAWRADPPAPLRDMLDLIRALAARVRSETITAAFPRAADPGGAAGG